MGTIKEVYKKDLDSVKKLIPDSMSREEIIQLITYSVESCADCEGQGNTAEFVENGKILLENSNLTFSELDELTEHKEE